MNKTRKITYLGIGIALYAAVSLLVRIPLVNRIKLDMGYTVFGVYLTHFSYASSLVGVLGCIIANLLGGGSFPIAWAIGQLFIGLSCSFVFSKTESLWIRLVFAAVSVFIGIGVIKTALEIAMFHFPLWAKFSSNMVAVVADAIPLLVGISLAKKIRLR